MTETGKNPQLRYDEGCLAVHALNVIGDRWALLVVRELMFAPRRFGAIRAGLPGISAGVLSQRLDQLIAAGVVRRLPGLGAYGLSATGRDLLPVLQAMCRWGAVHPGHDPRRFISPAALMISMSAMIGPAPPAGLVAGFRSGEDSYRQIVRQDGSLQIEAAEELDAPFVLEGSGNALARAVYGPTPLVELAEEGVIGLSGDAVAGQDYVGLFRLRP